MIGSNLQLSPTERGFSCKRNEAAVTALGVKKGELISKGQEKPSENRT
jgi:hypothetical protein